MVSWSKNKSEEIIEEDLYAILGFKSRREFENKINKLLSGGEEQLKKLQSKLWDKFKKKIKSDSDKGVNKSAGNINNSIKKSKAIEDKLDDLLEFKKQLQSFLKDQDDQGIILNAIDPVSTVHVIEVSGIHTKKCDIKKLKKAQPLTSNKQDFEETLKYIKSQEEAIGITLEELKEYTNHSVKIFLLNCNKKHPELQSNMKNAIAILSSNELKSFYNKGIKEGILQPLVSYKECRNLCDKMSQGKSGSHVVIERQERVEANVKKVVEVHHFTNESSKEGEKNGTRRIETNTDHRQEQSAPSNDIPSRNGDSLYGSITQAIENGMSLQFDCVLAQINANTQVRQPDLYGQISKSKVDGEVASISNKVSSSYSNTPKIVRFSKEGSLDAINFIRVSYHVSGYRLISNIRLKLDKFNSDNSASTCYYLFYPTAAVYNIFTALGYLIQNTYFKVDDITPAIYKYNRKPGEKFYKRLVSASKWCLSRYSEIINNQEYTHLNNTINTGQAIDSILKRLDQVTTVLNQFDEYQVGHTSILFTPIILELGKQIKSVERYGNTHFKALEKDKEKLESLKGIIVSEEVDILIPQIQSLNNRVKLLLDNIRNSGIQIPSKKVNTTPVVNVALSNQVGIVEESSSLDRKVRPSNPRKCAIFEDVQQVLQPENSVSDVSNVHTTKYVKEKLVVTVKNSEGNLQVKGNQRDPQPEVLPSAFNSNFNDVVVTGKNVETPTLEQKNSIQDNSKQLTNSDNKDATLLSASGTENLSLPESGNGSYHDSPASIISPSLINKEAEQNDTKSNKRQLNNSGNRSTTITQSTQRSKMPIIAIALATIAIPTALIAHFAFQASLLTTGIIAGLFLIAAAVTYCANKPLSSLGNIDAKVVTNEGHLEA